MKSVATGRHNLKHQILFWLWFCPRPYWGAHSSPSDPLAGFYGSYFYGEEKEGKRGEKVEGRGGDERRK